MAGPEARGSAMPRAFVLGGAMLWGTTGTTQALAPAAATPASIGAVRMVLGGVVLLGIGLALRSIGRLRGFFAPGLRSATLAAMSAMAAYQVAFFAGVARTGVAVGTIVGIGSAPMFTGALGWAVRRERPEPRWGRSTALAVVGCVLLIGAGGDARVDPLGVLLALAAGAAYAVYTVATKALLDAGHRPSGAVAVTFAGGGVLLLPVLLAGDLGWVLEPRGAAAAAWLGVATVGVAYLLVATGLRALPAATVATLTLAEPLTAGGLGVLLLGERPGMVAAAGVLLIVVGLVLLVAQPTQRLRARPTSS